MGQRQDPGCWPQPACRAKAHTQTLATPGGQALGFASSDPPRSDVGRAVGPQARCAGYLGYLRAGAQGRTVVLVSERLGCQLTVQVPVLLF